MRLLPSKSARELVNDAAHNPDFERELRRECRLAIASDETATPAEIGILLHRLSLHYPDRKLNPKEAALVAQDWLQDLDGIPHDLVELAFSKWRRGPKCAFFPKAGEILELVKAEVTMRKFLAKRAAEVAAALGGSV